MAAVMDGILIAANGGCSCRLILSKSSGAVNRRAPAPAADPAIMLCHFG